MKANLVFILILVFIFFGYQDADAQRRRGKSKKPKSAKVVQTPPNVSYTVSMSKPWTHLLEVEMVMNWPQMPKKAEVKMPVWTPGSYLIREYARHVQDFVALDANGNALDWRKTSKNTWQIDTNGAKAIRIGYYVYSNDLTVRTNELNYEHAFFTPAALLMYPKGQLKAPSTIRVRPYRNWKVATGLPPVAGQANTFKAENYDVLYDSPFEVSDFKELKFTVRGKPHRYVVTGDGNYDLQQIADDTAKMIEECYKLFGELPYDDYTFILNTRGGGGLEHLNSTALQWNRFGFEPESRYTAFLSLVAHEFFHLWNVKRIRPDALGPFDYENENYTKLLWVAEGTTSYYEGVLMRRAGLVNANYILDAKASIAGRLYRQPGRFQTSLEEASFDAWIKSYRPDENSVNRQISYYSKGELVNFLLDILIRTNSAGAKSLDDVMRLLNDEFYKKGKNFTPADFQDAAEKMAGTSLDGFFKKYVSGKEEIDYNQILNQIGLQFVSLLPESDKGYLGGNLSESNGRLRLTSVPANTPAYENGLNADDEILAIDGFRASRRFLTFYLGSKKSGDKVKLSVFRHDKLMELDVTLGKTPASGYKIVPVENPTEEQKRLYRQYLDEDLG
ncbi:MAG: M61 family metallopeptidase [Pyrinomonadaceae bacterium]|nr:M61 family metallopeptidase [Pyrinomonadaceae bacterium]